jgi:hypothetical protein
MCSFCFVLPLWFVCIFGHCLCSSFVIGLYSHMLTLKHVWILRNLTLGPSGPLGPFFGFVCSAFLFNGVFHKQIVTFHYSVLVIQSLDPTLSSTHLICVFHFIGFHYFVHYFVHCTCFVSFGWKLSGDIAGFQDFSSWNSLRLPVCNSQSCQLAEWIYWFYLEKGPIVSSTSSALVSGGSAAGLFIS